MWKIIPLLPLILNDLIWHLNCILNDQTRKCEFKLPHSEYNCLLDDKGDIVIDIIYMDRAKGVPLSEKKIDQQNLGK